MSTLAAYLLGLATIPALVVVWLVLSGVISQVTSTDRGWRCMNCERRWGFGGDGSVAGVARARMWGHRLSAHPGLRGRDVVAIWRGRDRVAEWVWFGRLDRAYPAARVSVPVSVVDTLARIPGLSAAVYALAYRHGRKTTHA